MTLIKGNAFSDDRGTLQFVNDFNFAGIKRFYTITHPNTSIVRAWQGHKIENKNFFVSKGKFIICWVEIDNWDNPGKDLIVNKQIICAEEPQILTISSGNANGFKALESDSTLVVFSDLCLEDSSIDMQRFDFDYWRCEE